MASRYSLMTAGAAVLPIVLLLTSCEENLAPRINKTEFARLPGIGNNSFTLRVEASDPEFDQLTYLWDAPEGTFTGAVNESEAVWVAPVSETDDTYKVMITVSDGKAQVTDTLQIPVVAVRYARLTGFAYFTGCRVPVGNAIITIDGKRDTTETDGSFTIDGVRVGRQNITAEKEDFIAGTSEVFIREGINETKVSLTSPKYTCRLSGNIFGNISRNPKPFFVVTILNPDLTFSELTNISSSSGYYEISGIPHGLVRIHVRDDIRARMETIVYLETNEYTFNIAVPEPFRFTDSRDNHEYEAVRVSSQVWMAENLAYLPRVAPSFEQGGVWVYGYSGFDTEAAAATENYKLYGCLYDWPTANADTHGNGKDICPPGWHLPTDDEWKVLEGALGMDFMERDSTGWRFTGEVGKKLKFESGWESDGNGSNSSSMSIKPAGYRFATGGFLGIGGYTNFWTASEFDNESAFRRYLYYNQDAIGRFNDYYTSGFSVRCVKDSN